MDLFSKRLVVLLSLCLTAVACVAETGDADDVSAEASAIGGEMMKRVVIARMYQRGHWTLPAALDYHPELYPDPLDRKAAYVCDAIAYLRPTYVSGLVRLDADQPIDATSNEAVVFAKVKKCIRDKMPKSHHVKFDVVLNALHYTDPAEGVKSAEEGAKKLRQRLKSADAALHPDAWFFDFYTKPWNDPSEKRFPEAMRAGITWIHEKTKDHEPQLVGGNAWGANIPDKTDFIAITDKGGMPTVEHLASKIVPQHVPLMMHVRNDPQVPKSEGLLWIEKDLGYRKSILKTEVEGQSAGYAYMFPVFFPLDEDKKSYDAVHDGNMLRRMCELMGDDAQCKTAPVLSKLGAPAGDDDAVEETPYVERIGVHRGYHAPTQQHLYSVSLLELTDAKNMTVEAESFFYLQAGAGSDGTAAFHRCYLGNGWHLLTTAQACEGAGGAIDEGSLGAIATTQQPGTVPLHRLYKGTPDHFYTTSDAERDYAVALGYAYEGVAGYVWLEP